MKRRISVLSNFSCETGVNGVQTMKINGKIKKKNKVLLYIPVAINNENALGGQVTAAKGIFRFIENKNMSFDLIDSAQATGHGFFNRRVIVFTSIMKLLSLSVFNRYKTSLFFKSTVFGLFIRFLPALNLKLKGTKTAIFFRNSSLIKSSRLEVFLAKILLKPYRVIFVQGTNLKKELVNLGFSEKAIYVIPNWLSPSIEPKEKFSLGHKVNVSFVFTGSMVRGKGVFSILEAIREDSKREHYTVTFIGDGISSADCKVFCEKYNLKNVFFVGALQHDDLVIELEKYDVLLLPSFSEGFPNSILEALALGLPVIASGVGEITDTVKNNYNGFIIDPEFPETILSAIHKYLNEPNLIEIHSSNAYKSVLDRHDWDTNCSKLFDILNRA